MRMNLRLIGFRSIDFLESRLVRVCRCACRSKMEQVSGGKRKMEKWSNWKVGLSCGWGDSLSLVPVTPTTPQSKSFPTKDQKLFTVCRCLLCPELSLSGFVCSSLFVLVPCVSEEIAGNWPRFCCSVIEFLIPSLDLRKCQDSWFPAVLHWLLQQRRRLGLEWGDAHRHF